MRCAHARTLISAAIDEELGATDAERLAGHLRRCEDCRRERELQQRLHAAFAQAERYEPRPGLALRVLAAARTSEPSRPRPLLFPGKALARAAVIGAVVATGVAAGNLLSPGAGASPARLLSLEVFDAAPPDSPGGAYLTLMEPARE